MLLFLLPILYPIFKEIFKTQRAFSTAVWFACILYHHPAIISQVAFVYQIHSLWLCWTCDSNCVCSKTAPCIVRAQHVHCATAASETYSQNLFTCRGLRVYVAVLHEAICVWSRTAPCTLHTQRVGCAIAAVTASETPSQTLCMHCLVDCSGITHLYFGIWHAFLLCVSEAVTVAVKLKNLTIWLPWVSYRTWQCDCQS